MNRKKPNIAGWIGLAVLCVAGAELAACRYFDPALYQRLTAPVRDGVQAVSYACQRTASAASAFWAELTAPKPEEGMPAVQLATSPALDPETPVSDPSLTEFLDVDGQQILTGGTQKVVYFNQSDEAWADEPYGTDDIGRYGCGPAAMAMAVSSMTDETLDPLQMAEWAVEQGHWAKRGGSYLSIVNGAADFGLNVESLEQTSEAMAESLLSGDLLVALMGPGHFTKGGHFILIHGVTLDGSLLVADPNSRDRSLTCWDPEVILDELSPSTSSGAPLWALSLPDN